MDKNKKKIIILVSLGIIIIFGVIAMPNMMPSIFFSFKEVSSTAIIGGVDGPTTIIYIAASGNWVLVLLYSLLLFAIDLIILGIIKIIEYKRKKNIGLKYLFIFMFNIIIVLLLFPNMIIQLLILNAIIALIYLLIIFLNKKVKNEPC